MSACARVRAGALAALVATIAAAQAPTEQMVELSVRVIGAAQKDGKLQTVSTGGGFFLDARHVVTTDACCGKTQDGADQAAIVMQGEKSSIGQPVWSGPGGIVILELKDPLEAPAVTMAPLQVAAQNEAAYSVVFSGHGSPTVSAARLQGIFKPDGVDAQVYRAAPPPDGVLPGGAMFNACGQVMGINTVAGKDVELAIAIDALNPGLEKTGVVVAVAGQPCGGERSGADEMPQPPKKGGEQGRRWRLPEGGEWVGVAIIAGLVGLALRRNTMQQAVRALTTRRSAVPSVSAAVRPSRPVLRGIAGQYAGSSVALDAGACLLGRDGRAANLVFGPESDSISKRHCMVWWDAARGVFVLEDLGSTNGTFLAAGERLAPNQPRDLQAGDRFSIGDSQNRFELGEE